MLSAAAATVPLILATIHTVGKHAGDHLTIQDCVDNAEEGDTCKIGPGIWREEVVTSKGITIEGEGPDVTKMYGTKSVPDNWKLWKGSIYSQDLTGEFQYRTQQVFVDDVFISEARWPNADLSDMLNVTKSWKEAAYGTTYGQITDPDLSKTNVDWNGAIATINPDKRVLTFTRTVWDYNKTAGTFNYSLPLPGEKPRDLKTYIGTRYFLSGILAALDSPGEWFLDETTWRLYVWMPDGKPPGNRVSMKVNDLCVSGKQTSLNKPISVKSLSMFSCTFTLLNCTGCLANNISLTYPSYTRRIEFLEVPVPGPMPNITMIQGDGNTISTVSLIHSNHGGMLTIGSNNTITDVLVISTDWLGTLDFPPIQIGFGPSNCGKGVDDDEHNDIRAMRTNLSHCGHWLGGKPDPLTQVMGTGNVIRHVTVTGFGNSGIVTTQLSCEVSYAHISMGGMIGCDHAGIHADNLPAPCMYQANSTNCTKAIHHNVVHDCREKCIRGDDASLNISAHHNVVFNCGTPYRDPRCGGSASGLVLKGDYHLSYYNTIFNVSTRRPCHGDFVPFTGMGPPPPSCDNPGKPACSPMNKHSTFLDIAAAVIYTAGGPPMNESVKFSGGFYHGQLDSMQLEDPENFNFAPKKTSPMYMTGISHGSVPAGNIGAIQPGEPEWRAGCFSFPGC
eukprot:TRINITY_DN30774_c0_g1_i1.p1 TRINITY_DN30774_c0_g1~~TRINITY_DN30774_c0_g1_i1.p1  ORF type:complete len:673 (+),score=92.48 TRINITY_DN30774_c0_g1_i1:60-2078(+)